MPTVIYKKCTVFASTGLKGLISLVMGAGRSVGQRIVESPKVDAISLAGWMRSSKELPLQQFKT